MVTCPGSGGRLRRLGRGRWRAGGFRPNRWPAGLGLALLLSLGLSSAGSLAQELLVPDPSQFGPPPPPLQPSFESMLFAQLEEGDRRLLPRLQRLPDGRLGVVYRRRRGEPPLSMAQLRGWMSNPPRWDREKATIRALLAQLRDLGVRLEIGPTRHAQAAGEWLPRQGVVRIRPDVPLRGSQEFAKVLNHEAIHVAQSCRAGGVRQIPTLLGLQRPLLAQDLAVLELPIYRNRPPQVQRLEAEAFGLQHDLLAGPGLLARFCGPPERQRIPSVESGRGHASRPAELAVLPLFSRR
ncbi:MAG: hypothetical protein ACK5N0_04560 [Synechococcaceae cyanobacterium]